MKTQANANRIVAALKVNQIQVIKTKRLHTGSIGITIEVKEGRGTLIVSEDEVSYQPPEGMHLEEVGTIEEAIEQIEELKN